LLQDKQSIAHPDPVLLVKNGKNDECYITYNIAPIYTNQNEDVIWRVLTFLNVTEKYKLEEERRKAKNLESLGLLAGGIAHDFNNILTVILTNLSLAKLSQEWESGLTELLDEAENATVRAKELTYQLLTFAKGGAPIRKLAQLKDIIQDTVNFVLQGTNVRSEFDLSADLWPVEIDQVQISQVLQNLVLNSLQAMPQGGVVRIEACNDEIREQKKVLLPPGKYLRISVKDQGTGIKPEDLPNIFDPYFTTKEKGKGLGLSISYSIIKRHEGHIVVESEFGKGTTAYIYLPVTC
jgi:signal transduction histidine kinase